MVQLVGYHAWKAAGGSSEITSAHVAKGVESAVRRVGRLVHEPALSELSAIDRSFLVAMTQDEGPSRMRDVADRLGVAISYAGVYRARLIAGEMIYAPRRGWVDFSLPSMREYLLEHAVADLDSDWAELEEEERP